MARRHTGRFQAARKVPLFMYDYGLGRYNKVEKPVEKPVIRTKEQWIARNQVCSCFVCSGKGL